MTEIINLKALEDAPDEMKQRILRLIESNSEFFIISGSDPLDLKGCCPSDGVGAANRLVDAGILQVVRRKSENNSCPVNIYALSGEIKTDGIEPEFIINRQLRERAKNFLAVRKSKGNFWRALLRWSLLLFVAISLGIFAANIWRESLSSRDSGELDLVRELDLPFKNGLLVLLFHRTQRCEFCKNMENHAIDTLKTYFSEDLQTNSISFRAVDMEMPRFKNLVKKYAIFTSTLVLIEIFEGREFRSSIVEEAWQLTNNRQKFMDMFRSKVVEFQKGHK